MYYLDGTNIYEIIDIDKFKELLDSYDLYGIKKAYKPTYQEELLNESMGLLLQMGEVESIPEVEFSYLNTCEYFMSYIVARFGQDVYDKMVDNFAYDLEYQIGQINYNKARLN